VAVAGGPAEPFLLNAVANYPTHAAVILCRPMSHQIFYFGIGYKMNGGWFSHLILRVISKG
jgi:hypothetical protein